METMLRKDAEMHILQMIHDINTMPIKSIVIHIER